MPNITRTFHLINSKKSTCGIPCHNCSWLLNTAPANLTENVPADFSKNVVSTVPFFVITDAVPYLQNKFCLYAGDYCLQLKEIIQTLLKS